MDYFVMSQDQRLLNAAKLKQPISPGPRWGAANTKIFYVQEGKRVEYPDYMETPMMLISENLKRMMSKYQPDIRFETIVLIEKESGFQKVYYAMTVPEIECASGESIYDKSGNLAEFVLDQAKVGHARIFCAGDYQKKLIVRLDVAESILRRQSHGIWFDKLKVEEKG